MQEILDFICRRFHNNCEWLTGNCYYFALILKDRFPQGDIYYDVINGHFVFKYEDKYYDWTGLIQPNGYLVVWSDFDKYDKRQKYVIIRDCLW